jgi:hypothetical protein
MTPAVLALAAFGSTQAPDASPALEPATLVLGITPVSAPAPEPSFETPEPASADGRFHGAVLPPELSPRTRGYWVVGVAIEEYGTGSRSHDELYGLAAMFRTKAWGPNALLMLKPSGTSYEDTRFLGGIGLRGYVPVLGIELSYGVAMHVEARLEDHFWLASATPLELGARLFSKNSWELELFLGARRAFAGELINSFLLDPNGFDNEEAEATLYQAKTGEPWRGFIRLVFGRRLD